MDRWIEGSDWKPRHSYTKDTLVTQLSKIKARGWITLAKNRAGRDGGIGNTIEDLLGIPENNILLADYGELELKTHRANSNSLISLFRYEPGPRIRGKAFIPYLVANYGWPIERYGPMERSLRIDIDAAGYAERGFIALINRNLRRVDLHFDSAKVKFPDYQSWLLDVEKKVGLGDLSPIPFWTFEQLEAKLRDKIKDMVYITVETKTGGSEEMRIVNARILQNMTLEKFLKGIEVGQVQIEFSARTHHNHGTAFRT